MQVEAIRNKAKCHTTFTKRRQCLFKKARNFTELLGGEIAVVAFSQAGNAFGFGHPSVEGVVNRYLADHIECQDNVEVEEHSGASLIEKEEEEEAEAEAEEPLTNMEKRICEAMGNGRSGWIEMVKGLGFAELEELEATMTKLKSKVVEVREGNTRGDISKGDI